MSVSQWSAKAKAGWISILSALGVYELVAILGNNPRIMPLTHLVVKYVPWWITMPVLVWLVWHFGWRYYQGAAYLERLGR